MPLTTSTTSSATTSSTPSPGPLDPIWRHVFGGPTPSPTATSTATAAPSSGDGPAPSSRPSGAKPGTEAAAGASATPTATGAGVPTTRDAGTAGGPRTTPGPAAQPSSTVSASVLASHQDAVPGTGLPVDALSLSVLGLVAAVGAVAVTTRRSWEGAIGERRSGRRQPQRSATSDDGPSVAGYVGRRRA